MLFNLGSAYCLRSEYDKARKCLHQVRGHGERAALMHTSHERTWEFMEFVTFD
jgi:hypothetical protein